MELLDSGYTQIGGEEALWKKIYVDSSGLLTKEQITNRLPKPIWKYRLSESNAILYMVQMVRNNHLYTLTCTALGRTKELASDCFNINKALFFEIMQSFASENDYVSPKGCRSKTLTTDRNLNNLLTYNHPLAAGDAAVL